MSELLRPALPLKHTAIKNQYYFYFFQDGALRYQMLSVALRLAVRTGPTFDLPHIHFLIQFFV